MFKGKIDLEGKLAQAYLSLNDIDAFEICSESIDEHYEGESVFNTEADIFIETDSKIFIKVQRSE